MATNDPTLENFLKTSDESFGKEADEDLSKRDNGCTTASTAMENAFQSALDEGDVF